MVVVRNLYKRGNIWIVRVVIPADIRAQWGKKEEIVSLHTAYEAEAIAKHGPVVAEIKGRIAALRRGVAPPPATAPQPSSDRLTPAAMREKIGNWRRSEIEDAYLAFVNGEREPLGSYEASQRSDLISRLRGDWPKVDSLNAKLASVIGAGEDHPALRLPKIREAFATAWADVLTFTDKFENDDFDGWEFGEDNPATTASTAALEPGQTIKLNALLDRFVATQQPPEEADIKEAWRRMVELFGDVDAASVTPLMAEDWVVAVKKLPSTRKPEIRALKTPELIKLTDQPVLALT